MKSICFLTILLLAFFNHAQTFEEIKDKAFDLEEINDDQQTFIDKMYALVGEDFDSLDLEILLNGPLIGSLLVSSSAEVREFTYGDLYQKLLEIQQYPFYEKIRNMKIAENTIKNRPADINNWEKDKLLIEKMVSDSTELERIRLYVSENSTPNETYETLMFDYRIMRAEEKALEREKYSSFLFENLSESNLFNEEVALSKGAEENKPIILYFTGHMCVNCRRIEQSILRDPKIARYFKEDFILFALYVDDRNELPETEKKTVTYGENKKNLETIGDAHIFYQTSRFERSAQPYFVVLNNENEIIGTASYKQNTIRDFQQFLDESIEAFEK